MCILAKGLSGHCLKTGRRISFAFTTKRCLMKSVSSILLFVDESEYCVGIDYSPYIFWSKYESTVNVELEKVYLNKQSLEECLRRITDLVNQEIEKNIM